MALKVFSSLNNGAVFIQPGGPNTKPYLVGCLDLGDIAEPGGKVTLVQCIKDGAYVTYGFTKAAPEPITVNLGTLLGADASYLETVECPATLFVNLRDCGKADVFENYVRSLILQVANFSNRTYTGLVKRAEDVPSMVTVDAEALPPAVRAFALTARRASIGETAALNDIAICDNARCTGPCGGGINSGDYAMVVSTTLNSSPTGFADAWFTTDGGSWSINAAKPFAAGVDAMNAACFSVGRSTLRRLVTQGEAVGGAPMKIAYSDDSGATWTTVSVGSVNGQFAADSGALFVLDVYNIWLVTSGGYIYYSADAGITWTAQESGILTTQTLHAVDFADPNTGYAVGNSNVVLKTIDGGLTWSSAGTGPVVGVNLTTVDVRDANHVWVGTAGGELWYTNDGGTTWAERGFTGTGVGEVADVDFYDDNVGFMLSNTAAPVGTLHITINGGYSWQPISTPTNAGLNALGVVAPDVVYAVGAAQGGSSVVIKATGG